MNNFYLALITIALCIVIFFIGFNHVKKAKLKRFKQEVEIEHANVSAIALEQLDIVGSLIDNRLLTKAEIQTKAEEAFNVILANNPNGMFNEVVNSTRKYIADELAKDGLA